MYKLLLLAKLKSIHFSEIEIFSYENRKQLREKYS